MLLVLDFPKNSANSSTKTFLRLGQIHGLFFFTMKLVITYMTENTNTIIFERFLLFQSQSCQEWAYYTRENCLIQIKNLSNFFYSFDLVLKYS